MGESVQVNLSMNAKEIYSKARSKKATRNTMSHLAILPPQPEVAVPAGEEVVRQERS